MQQWRDVLGSLPGHADALVRTVSRSLRTARSLSGRNKEEAGPLPPGLFEAPRTSINRAISPHRRVALVELPLSEVRRVRQAFGGTTNDVVLAVTAGALRSFFGVPGGGTGDLLGGHGARLGADRRGGRHLGQPGVGHVGVPGHGGGRSGGPTAPHPGGDPSAKEQSRVVGRRRCSPVGPRPWCPAVATRLTRLVTNLRLFDHVAPLFNLIVSNVPGPDFPLYLAGARMVAMYPLGPIVEGVGINVTVFSYLDTLYVGVQGCWDAGPGPRGHRPGHGATRSPSWWPRPTAGTGRCRGGTPNSLRSPRAGLGDPGQRQPSVTAGGGGGMVPAEESRAGQLLGCGPYADVAQLVEHHLAKVRVAGSNPVVRSNEESLIPLDRPCYVRNRMVGSDGGGAQPHAGMGSKPSRRVASGGGQTTSGQDLHRCAQPGRRQAVDESARILLLIFQLASP